ncbi:MAG: hypothetical protein RI957_142 [Verrucomicrobiota bacterium]|jgi:hypothetical protein
MNFRFSDDELQTLVELLSLATMVAEWNQHPAFQNQMAAINRLENKIFEHLYCAGWKQMIEFNEIEQHYQVTDDFQKKSFFFSCYEEFRQESFWEELVIRLADRDLLQRIGFEAWNQLTEDQRRSQTADLEKRYWSEFERHGIDHLRVIHPPGEG